MVVRRWVGLVFASTVISTAPCDGAWQQTAWQRTGDGASPGASPRFGAAVSPVGDLDGDGVAEIVVGAPGDAASAGSAAVVSGTSGATLRRHAQAGAGALFGAAVAGGGDLDGDGVGDYVIGAPRRGVGRRPAGRVDAWSGASGALLRSIESPLAFHFGARVALLGDHDGDGLAEIGVCGRNRTGALDRSPTKLAATRVFVLSGADGSLLHTRASDPPWVDDDAAICRLGDLNGDAIPEIGIGFPGGRKHWIQPHGGTVTIVDGGTFTNLTQLVADSWTSAFGAAIAGLGDVDRDGLEDFAVAEPGHGDLGRIHVHSGRLPCPRLYTWTGGSGDRLGTLPIAGRFDFDDDGFADVLVGNGLAARRGGAAATALVFSGRSGRLLYGFRSFDFGGVGLGRGASSSAIGDVDADGTDDLVLGAPDDAPGWTAVHLGNRAFLQADQEAYSPGETLRIEARGRPGHFLLVAIIDVSGIKTFIPVARGWLDALGEWSLELTVPPGMSGRTITAIARVWGPAATVAVSLPERIVFQ